MTAPRVFAALFSFACGLLLMAGLATVVAAADPPAPVAAADPADDIARPDAGPYRGIAETHLDGNGPQVAPPVVPPLPDPVAEPAEAAGQVWKLYKAGTLIPAIVLAVFFLFVAVRSKVAWLRTGNRAAVTASVLVAATMLAERAAAGATPNLSMVLGALMAGVLLYVRGDKASVPAVAK